MKTRLDASPKIGKVTNPIYVRDEDGAEILFPTTTEYVVKDKEENAIVKIRTEKLRKLDDDLPMIVEAYYEFLNK